MLQWIETTCDGGGAGDLGRTLVEAFLETGQQLRSVVTSVKSGADHLLQGIAVAGCGGDSDPGFALVKAPLEAGQQLQSVVPGVRIEGGSDHLLQRVILPTGGGDDFGHALVETALEAGVEGVAVIGGEDAGRQHRAGGKKKAQSGLFHGFALLKVKLPNTVVLYKLHNRYIFSEQ